MLRYRTWLLLVVLYKIGRIVGSHRQLSECRGARACGWVGNGYARVRSRPVRLLRLLLTGIVMQPLRVR